MATRKGGERQRGDISDSTEYTHTSNEAMRVHTMFQTSSIINMRVLIQKKMDVLDVFLQSYGKGNILV